MIARESITTRHDLKPGDIILMKHEGKAFHAMLYAPKPGEMGDIIHIGYGLWRSGVIKSTLDHQVDILSKNKKKFELHVIRSRTINPADIVAQAEKWLRYGSPFDEMRVSDLVQREYDHSAETSPELNVFQYLKYAARRDTAPMKPGNEYPYNNSGFLALSMTPMIHPAMPYNNRTPVYNSIFRYAVNKPDRPKGFMCIGFVLACIGAAALKNEIRAVDAHTGWVSLKYGTLPEQDSSYKYSLTAVRREAAFPDKHTRPGLHTLLSDEQLAHFDTKRLKELLTPAVANVNPQHASVHGFLLEAQNDRANWEDLGVLNRRNDFNKERYNHEKEAIERDISANREAFKRSFPDAQRHNESSIWSIFSVFNCCGRRKKPGKRDETTPLLRPATGSP